MAKDRVSAGLMMYRVRGDVLQVFLAHPGGPFFMKKDDGHWSIPKGEPNDGEDDLLATALREFQEEVGITPSGPYHELGAIRQKGGKLVHAWAFRGDLPDGTPIKSNRFTLEFPAGSGRTRDFPEVDRAQFFSLDDAKRKMKDTQWPFVERLAAWDGWKSS